MPSAPESLLSVVPVIPVVVIDDLDHAVPVARALVDGGLPVIELTLRTPVALDAIAAIHVTPEAALGGPLARVRDGDLVTVDAETGLLEVDLPDADFDRREATGRAPHDVEWAGTGRELFSGFRAIVGTAETGASVIRPLPAPTEEAPVVQHV